MIVYLIFYNNQSKNVLKIINLENKNNIETINLEDEEIKGRFECGVYQLVNGHLYYGNSLLKLRYDIDKWDFDI